MRRQSEAYKHREQTDRVHDIIGADIPRDLLKVSITETDTQIPAYLEEDVSIDGIVTVEQRDTVSVNQAGTVAVQEDTPLDVSASTVPVDHQGVIDISSRDNRILGDVDITALPDADRADWSGATIAADGSIEHSLAAVGADRLRGRVESTGSYDIQVSWLAEDGTELFTDEIASGVAAGTATDIDEPAVGPEATVTIVDTSSAEQTATGVFHLA
ncbi:hypothetical protein [Natrinema longum]|uniref:hypothetical protein n=1 Tax=Natrinema longum TaxID=370324 RepID=UPI001CCB102D|nr:hypothetical protein [Natrinema longum]